MAHHFEFRLTTAGRAALADGANRGINAIQFTKISVGSGFGPGGAADDGRAALRNQRDEAALAGSTAVAGEIALVAEISPSADYEVREVGLWGRAGSGAETLYAFWTDPAEIFDRAVEGTQTVVAGALSVAPATADVTVTPDVKVTLESQGLMPVWLLPGPHAATANMRIAVVAATASEGGTVSVAAGQKLSIGQPSAAGDTAFSRDFATDAWASADLDANETYFLRAQVAVDGSLLPYTAKGAIGDAAPASLKGTPDAAAGGGFASTALDARVAKIETGAPGSEPAVTSYALDARPRPGIAAWSAESDYAHPSACWGSDSALYVSKAASGPGTAALAQDPVADADRSHWRPALLTAGLAEIAAPAKDDMVRVGVRAGAAPGSDGWVEIQKLPGAMAPAGGVAANKKYKLRALAGGAFELALAAFAVIVVHGNATPLSATHTSVGWKNWQTHGAEEPLEAGTFRVRALVSTFGNGGHNRTEARLEARATGGAWAEIPSVAWQYRETGRTNTGLHQGSVDGWAFAGGHIRIRARAYHGASIGQYAGDALAVAFET